jgi:hypothetical protein
MTRKVLSSTVRKLSLTAAAAALVLGAASPAFAGGYRGYYGGHRHHHHGHGGKGAAIALGVIGGAIILNELSESRARDRYYEDRYYAERARTRAYYDGYEEGRYDERRYDDRYDEGAYSSGGDYYEDGAYEGDYGLEGGSAPAPVREPVRISSGAAYQTCLDHARRALGERGFVVTAPYRPDTVEDRGQALLMTATVTAQRGPDRWARAMSCEASEYRVYRMELI